MFTPATAIGGVTTATSPKLAIDAIDRVEAVMFQLASPGVADIKIEWAGGHSSVSNYPPLVALDPPVVFEAFTDNPPITASTNTDFGATPTGFHKYPFPAVLAKYVRIRITGVGANDAGTTATLWLLLREKARCIGP
jgi:hypothetical protein